MSVTLPSLQPIVIVFGFFCSKATGSIISGDNARLVSDTQRVEDLAIGILAGGGSTRMGRDKCRLEIAGVPLLTRLCRRLAPAAGQILVAAGAPDHVLPDLPETVRIVYDPEPGQGPLAGICAVERGLADHVARVFVCACDTPLLDAGTVRALAFELAQSDALVPRVDGRLQVLAAVYARRVLGQAPVLYDAGQRSANALLASDAVRVLDEAALRERGIDPSVFASVNTRDEWDRLRGRVE